MNTAESSLLANLSKFLRPYAGASEADLSTVRKLIADSLQGTAMAPVETILAEESIPVSLASHAAVAGMDQVEVEDENLGSSDTRTSDTSNEYILVEPTQKQQTKSSRRVMHRLLPFRASTVTGSNPAFVDAMKPEKILGPFLDKSNRPHWFETFSPSGNLIQVVRPPSSNPPLLIPLSESIPTPSAEYSLARGSVWIEARLLTPTAPAGAYCGMRIKKGKLKLNSTAAVAGESLLIKPRAIGSIEVDLDPPKNQGLTSGPGVDASECRVDLPTRAMPSSRNISRSTDKLFTWKKGKAKLIQSKKDLEEALKSSMTGGISDPLFEFSTPALNDWYQAIGAKILGLTENENLIGGSKRSKPQKFEDYYNYAVSRFADSPNGLVIFIVGDICRKQRETNKSNRNLALFNNQVCFSEEHFEQQKELYTQLHIRLPGGNDVSNFILVLSEMLEACLWLMFLGDPRSWFATKDPSGKYYSVPRTGIVEANPAYFRLHRKLPAEIEKHLLDTFHPDLTDAERKDFREYYKAKKM